jgi:hypothetical protein
MCIRTWTRYDGCGCRDLRLARFCREAEATRVGCPEDLCTILGREQRRPGLCDLCADLGTAPSFDFFDAGQSAQPPEADMDRNSRPSRLQPQQPASPDDLDRYVNFSPSPHPTRNPSTRAHLDYSRSSNPPLGCTVMGAESSLDQYSGPAPSSSPPPRIRSSLSPLDRPRSSASPLPETLSIEGPSTGPSADPLVLPYVRNARQDLESQERQLAALQEVKATTGLTYRQRLEYLRLLDRAKARRYREKHKEKMDEYQKRRRANQTEEQKQARNRYNREWVARTKQQKREALEAVAIAEARQRDMERNARERARAINFEVLPEFRNPPRSSPPPPPPSYSTTSGFVPP